MKLNFKNSQKNYTLHGILKLKYTFVSNYKKTTIF